MFINRITFKVKPSVISEAVKLLKAEIERSGSKAKIYTPTFGPLYVIVVDFEFESLEACSKFWDGWYASTESTQFFEKWNPLVESEGANEFWKVE